MATITDANLSFKESISHLSDEERRRKWKSRAIMLSDELRVGDWDFERLYVDRKLYEETVKRYKGVTKFNHKYAKMQALEARAVLRFLHDWKSRADNLDVMITECIDECRAISEYPA